MNAIRLTKSQWGRRRFVQGPAFFPIENWFDEQFLLEERIRQKSGFQKIGQSVLIEVQNSSKMGLLILEVVGIPQQGFKIFDLEAQEVFIHEVANSSFLTNFQEILETAEGIIGNKTLGLADFFHIVVDGEKIALHFFRQKDYIHSEH